MLSLQAIVLFLARNAQPVFLVNQRILQLRTLKPG